MAEYGRRVFTHFRAMLKFALFVYIKNYTCVLQVDIVYMESVKGLSLLSHDEPGTASKYFCAYWPRNPPLPPDAGPSI